MASNNNKMLIHVIQNITLLLLLSSAVSKGEKILSRIDAGKKPETQKPTTDSCRKRTTFRQDLKWSELKEEARKTNKKIFLTIYPTYDGFSKAMEREIFNSETIAGLLNENFISKKLHTNKSPSNTREDAVSEAKELAKQYKITTTPTHLFLHPNGEIICKETGFKSVEEFTKIINKACDPKTKYKDPFKRYNLLIQKYRSGKLSRKNVLYIMETTKKLGNHSLLDSLKKSYLMQLNQMTEKQILSNKNIIFIAKYLDTPNDEQTMIILNNQKRINRTMKDSTFARKVLNKIIWNKEVSNFLSNSMSNPNPNWDKLYNDLQYKYSQSIAEEITLRAKVRWYGFHKKHFDHVKYFTQLIEQYGIDTTETKDDYSINSIAFDAVLQHSDDRKQLSKYAEWMRGIIYRAKRRNDPFQHLFYDTYANLMHKLGETETAIEWEKAALEKARFYKQNDWEEEYIKTISKMERKERTW